MPEKLAFLLASTDIFSMSQDVIAVGLLQGRSYTKVNVPKDNTTWMIENAIAQYKAPVDGTDMHVQTFRTATGTALESWSSDGGYNWTFPVNSTLPNPNSRGLLTGKVQL